MACYSHSRISCFEQCRYKYKLQYIDRVRVDIPATIECFMGDIVHRTLEKLYRALKFQKIYSEEQLLGYYNELWDKEWTDDILIVKEEYNKDNYRKMGEKHLSDYYERFYPFDGMTILGIETQDRMLLPDGNQWHVRIDKLGCVGDTYYVCDYKTNSYMKDQEEADSDRQLAMYSVWVKNRFPDAKKVVLMWHMLAFNKDVVSSRTDEQLRKLQEEVVCRIKEIEECSDYQTNPSALCNYCVFKSICPSFKHMLEIEDKPAEEFKQDFGVMLVDEYSRLDLEEKQAKEKKEIIKQKLIAFAKEKGVNAVFGSNKKASVKAYDTVVYPEDKQEVITLIKDKGLFEDVSMISYPKLSSMILNNQIDKEIIDKVKTKKSYRISISERKA